MIQNVVEMTCSFTTSATVLLKEQWTELRTFLDKTDVVFKYVARFYNLQILSKISIVHNNYISGFWREENNNHTSLLKSEGQANK